MADARIHRAKEPSTTRIEEIDILWMTAGLGCDGDTIAITAATQPSLEDIVTGALPWIPAVQFYNPFLAYENGDDFLCPFRDAADGKSEKPFILVVEGSIPGPVIRTSASHRGDTDVASKVRQRGKNHLSHNTRPADPTTFRKTFTVVFTIPPLTHNCPLDAARCLNGGIPTQNPVKDIAPVAAG